MLPSIGNVASAPHPGPSVERGPTASSYSVILRRDVVAECAENVSFLRAYIHSNIRARRRRRRCIIDTCTRKRILLIIVASIDLVKIL